MLTGPPEGRRRLLDGTLFHVEQGFLAVWRRYAQAIRQRNAGLRRGILDGDSAWREELAQTGEQLTAVKGARRRSWVKSSVKWRRNSLMTYGVLSWPFGLAGIDARRWLRRWIKGANGQDAKGLRGWAAQGRHQADPGRCVGVGGVVARANEVNVCGDKAGAGPVN